MEWKKSIEHIPTKAGWYFIRDHHGKKVYYWWDGGRGAYEGCPAWVRSYPREEESEKDWFICKDCLYFEWLDEE